MPREDYRFPTTDYDQYWWRWLQEQEEATRSMGLTILPASTGAHEKSPQKPHRLRATIKWRFPFIKSFVIVYKHAYSSHRDPKSSLSLASGKRQIAQGRESDY